MASIVKRGKHYCVVYNYQTEKGDRKQKWESYRTKAEAEQRRHDIEYAKSKGELNIRTSGPCLHTQATSVCLKIILFLRLER